MLKRPLSAWIALPSPRAVTFAPAPIKASVVLVMTGTPAAAPTACFAGSAKVARQEVEQSLLKRRDQDAAAGLDGRGA